MSEAGRASLSSRLPVPMLCMSRLGVWCLCACVCVCVCVVPVFVLVCVRGLGDPSAGSRCSGRLRVLHRIVRAGLLSLACCLSCLLFCLICDSQPLACDDRFSPSQTLPLALSSLGRPWGNLWPGSGVLIVDCGVPRLLAHRDDASISFFCSAVVIFGYGLVSLYSSRPA